MALKEHNFHLFLSLRRLSFPISKCIPSYLAAAKDQKVFMDPPFFPPLNCPSPLLFSYISVYVWVIPFISWQGFYLSLISNPPNPHPPGYTEQPHPRPVASSTLNGH